MTNAERERWVNMVHEISDICNTSIVTDRMTLDQVIEFFYDKLQKIDGLLVYPDSEPVKENEPCV